MSSARDLWWAVAPWVGLAVLVWAVVFGLLLGIGALLSRATLELAAALPSRPTGEVTAPHRVLRGAYQAVLASTCVFYYLSLPLLIAVVVMVGGWLMIWAETTEHKVKAYLGVPLLVIVTIVIVVKSILGPTSSSGMDIEPLDLREHPKLRSLLDEVAEKVGTQPADRVFLAVDSTIAVFEHANIFEQLAGRTARCLVLGVGALEGLSLGALRAILAHEYGHYSNRDTAGGGFALSVRRSMQRMETTLEEMKEKDEFSPAWGFFLAFRWLFLRVSQGASRLQEILADRWAVYCYGAHALEAGLRHMTERELTFNAPSRQYLVALLHSGAPMRNIYAEVRSLSSAYVGGMAGGIRELVNRMLEAETLSPYDSHPRTLDRIRWAHALRSDASPGVESDVDAWTVVGSREAIELSMTEVVRRHASSRGVMIPREPPPSQQ